MTDRPIPFSAPMVRALLDGRKTQTRRVLKPAPFIDAMGNFCAMDRKGKLWNYGQRLDGKPCLDHYTEKCVRFAKGDCLWVRETHYRYGHWQPIAGKKTKAGRQKWGFVATTDEVRFDPPADYRKGRHHKDPATPAWHKRLARFMPRWASRLTLTVTDVRVQWLQEITPADTEAEGVQSRGPDVAVYRDNYDRSPEARRRFDAFRIREFKTLWNSINGDEAWEANPWVAALTFTVERRNIDARAA